jgi:hypothetical protein
LYFLWSPAALAAVSRPPLPVGLDVTVEAPQVYTAEVALLGAEEGDDGSLRLRLRLSGGEAAVEVSEVCRFLDGRKEISPAGFIGLYKGKKIVIDFLEVRKGSYLIVECRGAAAQRR